MDFLSETIKETLVQSLDRSEYDGITVDNRGATIDIYIGIPNAKGIVKSTKQCISKQWLSTQSGTLATVLKRTIVKEHLRKMKIFTRRI